MSDVHPIPDPSMVASDVSGGRAPAPGPVSGGEDIQAAPPGTPHDGGSDDTVGGSVAEAEAKWHAWSSEHETPTHVQGMTMGDLMTLPPAPDQDTTVLGYVPPPNIGGI